VDNQNTREAPAAKGKSMIRLLIGVALGAAGGYAYYRLVGCSTGVCPITSNPYVSTVYGAVMGALLSGAFAG
jgi:hypothetical protein